jgi:hypothetical protein
LVALQTTCFILPLFNFFREEPGAHTVGKTDPGNKLVLVVDDGTVRRVAQKSFVLNHRADSPTLVDRVTGGDADVDILDPGLRIVPVKARVCGLFCINTEKFSM